MHFQNVRSIILISCYVLKALMEVVRDKAVLRVFWEKRVARICFNSHSRKLLVRML